MFSNFSSEKSSHQSYDHLNPVIAPFQNVLENKNKYIKIEGNNAFVTANKKEAANIQQITDYVNHLLNDSNCSFNELTVLNQFYQKEVRQRPLANVFRMKKSKEIKKYKNDIEETKTALNKSLKTRKVFIDLAMRFIETENKEQRRRLLESLDFDILKNVDTLISILQKQEGDLPSKSEFPKDKILSPQASKDKKSFSSATQSELRLSSDWSDSLLLSDSDSLSEIDSTLSSDTESTLSIAPAKNEFWAIQIDECLTMLQLMPFSESQIEKYREVLEKIPANGLNELNALLIVATEGDILKESETSNIFYTKKEKQLRLAEDYPQYKILKEVIQKILEGQQLQPDEILIGQQAIKHLTRERLRFKPGPDAVKTVTFDTHAQVKSIKKNKLHASSTGFPISSKGVEGIPQPLFSDLSKDTHLTESKIMGTFKTFLQANLSSLESIITPIIDETLYEISAQVEKGELNPTEALKSFDEKVENRILRQHSIEDKYDKDTFIIAFGNKQIELWKNQLKEELSKFPKIDEQKKREILSDIIIASPPTWTPLPWNEKIQGWVLDACLGKWKKGEERSLESQLSLSVDEIVEADVMFRGMLAQDPVKTTLLNFFESLSPNEG
jgi:hypothetical protein